MGAAALCAGAVGAVPPECRASTSGLAFGEVTAQTKWAEAVGLVTIVCDGGGITRVEVELSSGAQDGSVPLLGGIRSPRATVFLDPSRTVRWGDGSGGSSRLVLQMLADGRPRHVPVYASLEVGGEVVAGRYEALLSLTVHVDDLPAR